MTGCTAFLVCWLLISRAFINASLQIVTASPYFFRANSCWACWCLPSMSCKRAASLPEDGALGGRPAAMFELLRAFRLCRAAPFRSMRVPGRCLARRRRRAGRVRVAGGQMPRPQRASRRWRSRREGPGLWMAAYAGERSEEGSRVERRLAPKPVAGSKIELGHRAVGAESVVARAEEGCKRRFRIGPTCARTRCRNK